MSTLPVLKNGEPFSEELIYDQLNKIFLCPAFSSSDILRHFLRYIIQETLAGRSNTIKEYTIAVNVLGKPISFKPQHDAIVRIHAGRLRRALNYYYKEKGKADKIEISVPKGSYVPAFGTLLASEQIREVDKDYTNETGFKGITLVVLPFKTFETDKSRTAFTENLGQQLSAELGRFSDFSVISYYTTQLLTSKNKEIPELVSLFGAQYVITGSLQFESRRLRVAVQLTDSHSGAQVWTETYHLNYSSSNLFEVADHIVGSVIGVLGDFNGVIMQLIARDLTRSRSGKTCTTTLPWYYEFYTRFNEEGFRMAYSAMENAVVQNPTNEIAWALLGELSLLAFLFNQTTRENPLIFGLKCARTALRINPLSQEGHITMALANIFLNNRQTGIEELEYAFSLNPNASGEMGIIGCLMISAGEYDRGIGLIRRSMERNKSYPAFFHLFTSIYHFKQKEYFLAYQQADKMGMPDLALSIILRVSILTQLGRKADGNAMIRTFRENTSNKSWISKEYIQRFVTDEDLVEQLYNGLKSYKMHTLTVA
jgi:TolB-like protein